MKINSEQKKAFLFGIAIIALFLYLHFSNPNSVFSGHVIALVLIWLFVLFALRTKAPLDYNMKYKSKSLSLIEQGVCPFCEKNPISEFRVKTGYTKANFWMGYYVFWIKYRYNRDELISSVPLCLRCKDKFLQHKLLNPSFLVLEHKKGFSLGLKNPYDKSNLFIREI
jgi:hypothetical protein